MTTEMLKMQLKEKMAKTFLVDAFKLKRRAEDEAVEAEETGEIGEEEEDPDMGDLATNGV